MGSFRILNNGQYWVITVFACLDVTKTVLANITREKKRKKKRRKMRRKMRRKKKRIINSSCL